MMTKMNMKKADAAGKAIIDILSTQSAAEAYAHLAPTLAERTPFRYLERIGAPLGRLDFSVTEPFFNLIADHKSEGGWVVIGGALNTALESSFEIPFDMAAAYTLQADIWYACDIFGERVPGPALRMDFPKALNLLADWRDHPSRWIRRMVGVAVHFWAKRARGETGSSEQVQALLAFLSPMFSEWDMDAVKGIGWGLKTLGRYYPDLVTAFIHQKVVKEHEKHRSLMVRKALTYLNPAQKAAAAGQA